MAAPIGFGLGDFVIVGKAAHELYKKLRDSPAQYQQLTTEAQQFSDLLQNFRELVIRVKLTGPQFAQLVEHEKNSQQLLDRIDEILDRYQGLHSDAGSSKVSQKLAWSKDTANDLRTRITSHVCVLQAFYISISQCAILAALEWMKLSMQAGKTQCPSVATLSQASIHEDDDDTNDSDWSGLTKDLENLGITSHMVKTHRDLVLRYLENAVAHGELPFRGSYASLYSGPVRVYQDVVREVTDWMATPSRGPSFISEARLEDPVAVASIADQWLKELDLSTGPLSKEHGSKRSSREAVRTLASSFDYDPGSVKLDQSTAVPKYVDRGTTADRGDRDHPQVEIFKSFRVSVQDPTRVVLPVALKRYNITDDWREYALYLFHGDEERCLGLEEKPLLLFKQMDKEGRKPMFMLRRHKATLTGFVTRNGVYHGPSDAVRATEDSNEPAGWL